ncbi:MAG: HEAT repeat domain-containing protein [Planctomycetes bacterium]|nr:HEAT repeat domain-containing protein [Planctomycetota bacterium]
MSRDEPRKTHRFITGVLFLLAAVVSIGIAVQRWPALVEWWLLRRLESSDAAARTEALDALLERRSARAVGRLVEILAEDPAGLRPDFSPRSIPAIFFSSAAEEEAPPWPKSCKEGLTALVRLLGARCAGDLRLLLRSPRSRERLWAAGLLGEIGPAAVESAGDLFDLLADAEPEVRQQAANALASVAHRHAPALEQLEERTLDGDRPFIERAACADALRHCFLIARHRFWSLRNESPPREEAGWREVEAAVLRESHRLCKETAERAFRRLIESPEPSERHLGLWGASQILFELESPGHPLLGAVLAASWDEAPAIRERGQELIDIYCERGAGHPFLLRHLLCIALDDRAEELRDRLLSDLTEQGADITPELLLLLERGGSLARAGAARALGSHGKHEPSAMRALLTALGDEDSGVRTEAIGSILERGIPEEGRSGIRAVALRALSEEESPRALEVSIAALIEMDEISADLLPRLASLLDADDPQIRSSAIQALACIGEPAVLPLRRMLSHEDFRTRREAAQALGDIGPAAADALEALEALRSDPSPSVRFSARRAAQRVSVLDGSSGDE